MKRIHTVATIALLLALILSACQPGADQPTTSHPIATTAVQPAAPSVPVATEAPIEPITTTLETELSTVEPVVETETLTPPPPVWSGALPILTGGSQDLTFGPGQLVVAFGEGFQPGETVAVSLIHDTQGVLLNTTIQADSLGYVMAVKRIKQSASEAEALPAGRLVYQFAGAAQTMKYGFYVDYALPPGVTSKGCGFYPQKAAFNGYQVFFCGGLQPGQAYQLTSQMGEAADQVVNQADAFGLAVFPLKQSSDTLFPGVWTVTLGLFTESGAAPTDLGLPPMTVEIIPDK